MAIVCIIGFLPAETLAVLVQVPVASFSGHNRISAPFPSTCPKRIAALAGHKSASRPVLVSEVKAKPASSDSIRAISELSEMALQTKASPQICQNLQRSPIAGETSPLVAAVIGARNSGNKSKLRVGYGKLAPDMVDASGKRIRIEEPGCLYVKTSVSF